jgi:hypothetical protein
VLPLPRNCPWPVAPRKSSPVSARISGRLSNQDRLANRSSPRREATVEVVSCANSNSRPESRRAYEVHPGRERKLSPRCDLKDDQVASAAFLAGGRDHFPGVGRRRRAPGDCNGRKQSYCLSTMVFSV